jgi:hypothetical protein
MANWTARAACLLVALIVAGCDDMVGGPGSVAPASSFTATGGATVSQRVQQLRADVNALASGVQAQVNQLQALRTSISGEARTYNTDVSQITSRLSVGTTPANPELVGRWNNAQAHLDKITGDIGGLNSLATQVTTQASVAGHLLDTIRSTYNVGGAVDEDHRQLRQIEAETNRTMQSIDRLIGDLNGEISRQNAFLAAERANLAGLSYGVSAGRLGGGPATAGAPRPYPGRRN